MEVLLSPEVQDKVNRAAAESDSIPAEYVSKLVETYIDHDAWFRAEVQHGLDQLDAGEFLTHEQVQQMIAERFRK
ncbi:hypothetical protein F183_A24810 [Bryobacterales bacterium F-183]|nr:hypothetical protein F183_A24810 [Bryobacterales bacterium F-183]